MAELDLETSPLLALAARTGKSIPAAVEISDTDGSLAILSRYEHGYRSAHRDYAQRHFKTTLWCVNRVSWLNRHGVRVVLTRWSTEEYRAQKVEWIDGKSQPLTPATPKDNR